MKKIIILILIILPFKIIKAQVDSLKKNENYKVFNYPNGKISSEGIMKNGKPVGFWISYFMTGVKKSEGKWKNNQLDSIWIFYDQVGDTTEKINYYLGKKNGYHYRYFKNEKFKNQIQSKELYVNGKRNGISIYYYSNGNVWKEIPYLNDKKQGIGYEYDQNSNIITLTRYRNNKILLQEKINRYNQKGEKDGVWKEFYENGNVKDEKNYSNGKLNGIFKIYNKDRKLLEKLYYKNGEVDIENKDYELEVELKEEYDKKGNLIFQGSYKNDKPIGIHRKFNENGKVISTETYNLYGKVVAEGIVLINGKEDGKWVYYYDNGNKKAEGKYLKGKQQGNWKFYYPNGKIKQQGNYSLGKLTGSWKWYYDNGYLLKEEFYIYGKQDGEAIEYSELGEIISKGNYIEGFKEGNWIYKIGDQEYKGKYVMGEQDGTWKSYYIEEETVSFEGRYIQGIPDGKHKYYYPDGILKEERYYDNGIKIRSWSKYDEKGELIVVIQYRDGDIYKINGEKVNFNQIEEEN